jgi:hypothetical protein
VSPETQTLVDVRPITDAEVDFFVENGWVKLPELIDRGVALDLLSRVQARMGVLGDTEVSSDKRKGHPGISFRNYYLIDQEDELFRAVRFHPQLGRNAARLYGRDMPIRSMTTNVAAKLPAALKTEGAGPTKWHQDQCNVPVRATGLSYWLALGEVTPEMGSVQFYSGSQRLGWLTPPVEEHPRVQACTLMNDLHLKPGDATAHSALVVHGAHENYTDHTRWGWIINTFPGDAPYLDFTNRHTTDLDLEPDQPLDHPSFPLIYAPAGEPV